MVLALNTGSYVGNGYSSGGYMRGCSTSAAGHVASSTKLNRIAKDVSAGYTADIEAIQQYLENGKVDKAIDLYNQLLNEISETADDYGYDLSEGQKASILTGAYRYTTGESFNGAMQQNTSSSFITGIKEGIPVVGWFVEGTSSDEALAKASGTKTEFKDKVIETAGAVASGVATGAAAGAVIGWLGGPIGAVGGAIIGGIAGVIKTIVK